VSKVFDPVEQTAIEIATAYAVANGYDADDRRAVGLVLVGMAIAAGASTPAQAEILRGYYRQQPADAQVALSGWSRHLTRAAS
jgi:hypothetical protein